MSKKVDAYYASPIIVDRVREAGLRLGAAYYVSKRGTPMLIKTVGGLTMSFCYFGRSRIWRAFYPFPSYEYPNVTQQHIDFPSLPALQQFVASVKAGREEDISHMPKGQLRMEGL